MSEAVRRWNSMTKAIVAMICLAIGVYLLYSFREVIAPLGMALLLAFILNPIVNFMHTRLHMSRGLAATLIFLLLVILLLATLAAPVAVVPSIQRAITSLQTEIEDAIRAIGRFLEQPLEIWDYTFDLSSIYEELSRSLTAFVSNVVQGTLDIVINIASFALWLVFILIAAFYLVKDADRFSNQLDRLAPPGYGEDFRRLRNQITKVWGAFLRAQLLLGVVVAIITSALALVVGLPYAVALGVLAGFMEFVPSVGPIIAAVPAVLLAVLQGSATFPALDPLVFAAVVAVMYIIIQQVENNVLVPRIMGGSLKLHPALVLVALVVGGLRGGILGLLMASPILATGRVLARYIYHRLYDRDPFAEPEKPPEDEKPGALRRFWDAAAGWLRRRLEARDRVTDQPGEGE
jgi:predicted PurR-regulated permease PerM